MGKKETKFISAPTARSTHTKVSFIKKLLKKKSLFPSKNKNDNENKRGSETTSHHT